MDPLLELIEPLPVPADYFKGLSEPAPLLPRHPLLFLRRNRDELRRATFESRPHHRYVLVFNLKTRGIINLDGLAYPLEPGEAHLIFPYQFHTYHDLESEALQWLFLTFETGEDERLGSLRHHTIRLDADSRACLHSLVALYQGGSDSLATGLFYLRAGELLLRLIHFATTNPASIPSNPGEDGDLLQNIHSCVSDALPEPLAVPEIAKHLGVSERTLRSRFRKAFGVSLGHYLREYRLHEAVALMRHSRASLTEIAHACGFSSSAAFSRAFRAWAGTTPGTYRKQGGNLSPAGTSPVNRSWPADSGHSELL